MKKLLAFAAVSAAVLSAQALDMDLFEKLVAIPSVSANIKEVNRATRFVQDYLVKRGLNCTVETMDDGREVLYAAVTPGKRHDFVFAAHLDVVAPGKPSHFTIERKAGDRVEGRGVRDCKGNAVAVIETLCELAGKDFSVGCIFGPDEEIGGHATKWMVEQKGYVPGKMVIVTDSGYGKICYAQKGQTFIRIKATGRSGHSSRPWKCDDSITKVMQAYVKIREIWDRRHPLPEDKWSDVMVPTQVHADGGVLNMIPPRMDLILNLRSVNPGAKDELFELAKEVSVVHDLAHGRLGVWSDLHQIEPLAFSHALCLISRHNAEHLTVCVKNAHRRHADLVVYASERSDNTPLFAVVKIVFTVSIRQKRIKL